MSVPLHDARARAAAETDLRTSLRIEAGAGTGKTTALVKRVIALIRGGTSLSRIVAITFTEKAAGELRVRLRRKLEDEVRSATDPTESARLRDALTELDAATISTIHGFCQSLLRERPVEAGLDPGFELEEGAATYARFDTVFARFLAEAGDVEPTVDPRPLRAALERGVGLEAIRAIAVFLTQNADLAEVDGALPPPDAPPRAHDVLEAALRLVDRIVVAAARTSASDTYVVAMTPVIDALRELRTQELDSSALERALCAGPKVPKAGKKGNQRLWPDKDTLAAAREFAVELEALFAAYRASCAAAVASALAHCLLEIPRRLARDKHAAGVIGFDDMLRKTRDLLRDRPDVRRRFQQRFDTLMLDEFQDTDPLQAEIAFYLAEDPDGPLATSWDTVKLGPGRLFLVGDPKQSIYRFRRADLDVYRRAGKLLEASGGRTESITVNFRSAPAVLDWVNARFQALFSKPEVAAFQPPYESLQCGPDAADESARVVVLGRRAGAEPAANVERARLDEANAIGDLLVKFANGGPGAWSVRPHHGAPQRPATFGDCALLFRATSNVHVYEQALRARGIPFRVAGGKNFYQRAEVKCAVALFRAVDEPSDTIAVVAALRSPLFAIPDSDLAAWSVRGGSFDPTAKPCVGGPEPVRVATALLAALHARRHATSLPAFVDGCYAATRMLEIFHLKPGGEARVANLTRFVDIARRLEAQGLGTFRAFVSEIRQLEADSGQEEESGLLDEEVGAVSLLTIHKAKGLEFPVVVLADLGRFAQLRNEPFVDRTEGAPPRLHFCVGGSDARLLETPGFAEAQARDRARSAAEEQRLLYVAATRAQSVLVLPRLFDARAEDRLAAGTGAQAALSGDALFHDADEATRRACWIEVDPDASRSGLEQPFRLAFDPEALTAPLPAAARDVLRERGEFHQRLQAVWSRADHARAVTSASAAKDTVEPRAQARPTGPAGGDEHGRAFGVLVHAMLEDVDWKRPDLEALGAFARARAAAEEFSEAAVREAIDLVTRFLASPLAKRIRAAQRVIAEMPFVRRLEDGSLMEGAIDLVVDEGDQGLLVVDWKTDAAIGPERMASYRAQIEIYRAALRAVCPGREVRAMIVSMREGRMVQAG
ncbi:MAG: UvrD-helicase domain-containing protein [Planctomycetes bacterium]|nr:UvrD-helicase domain-containing protein [Planctomycetota bacterium]